MDRKSRTTTKSDWGNDWTREEHNHWQMLSAAISSWAILFPFVRKLLALRFFIGWSATLAAVEF
jgi:hypothetical protein